MNQKKRLITRMAWYGGIALAVSLLVGGAALLVEQEHRQEWKEQQRQQRSELFEQSRLYLGELAERIDTVPIDPALIGEVESDYFEQYADGPMAVWGLATDGAFLFGVPRESFSRLNSIYDREITPRLSQGVFYDRQSFFLGHLDGDSASLSLRDLTGDQSSEEANQELWEHLSHSAGLSDGAFVVSSPIRTSAGEALGSLYLKRLVPQPSYYDADDRTEAVRTAAGVASILSFLFLWILLPTWVYVDAQDRGTPRASLFALLTAVSSVVGLVVYLIARPESQSLVCPGCSQEIDGGSYCPHCGNDLSAAFCQTCSYPLQPDWVFCPSCRTEIAAATSSPGGESVSREGSGSEEPLPEPG